MRFGGRLDSLEELFELGRVIAGRDPAVTIIANSSLGAAVPVWLAGSAQQRRAVADAVLADGYVALGMTEREHGADLLATGTTARRDGAEYIVDGEKWLINNAGLARFVCLLARDPDRSGMRSLSFLLVDLDALPASEYEVLTRIRTHGVRAAQISGIRFRGTRLPADALIARPGSGLELAAASLAVTRTLIPVLSLGALDTALRCCAAFLGERRLYGVTAVDIPYVHEELAAALVDLRVANMVARSCVRALHVLPDLSPVSSAVAKYLVPRIVETRVRRLAVVLGARSYLREDHWSGIFEKLRRDVRLFGLFDGSEPVVLSALAAQGSCLTVQADPRRADAVFAPGAALGPALAGGMGTFADDDPVTAGLGEACADLDRIADARQDDTLRGAMSLLRAEDRRTRAAAEDSLDPRSLAGQRFADRYARLFAAACLARAALAEGGTERPGGRVFTRLSWLGVGLTALLDPGARMPRDTARMLYGELARGATVAGDPAPGEAGIRPEGEGAW